MIRTMSIKKKYYLTEIDPNKNNLLKFRACATAAQVYLFHGGNFTERLIFENWNYDDDPPPISFFKQKISIKNVKWYLYNFVDIQEKIWNADFIRGVSKWGKI